MLFTLRKASLLFVVLLFLSHSVHADGTSKFEGIVKDPRGKPIKDAEVRVEAKNEAIIGRGKTDASGHYVTSTIPAGAYKVHVVINSVTKSSLANVKTKNTGATRLDFAIKGEAEKRGPASHRTGSNLW
jgi:uncharacterized protein YfaS (alpha-2-macroglobulin family)